MVNEKIQQFEKNANWVATASRKDSSLVAILHTASHDEKFCLYDSDFTYDPLHPIPEGFGPPTYSRQELEEMFSSKDLLLVSGGLPPADRGDL